MNWCEKHDYFKRTCPWCEIRELEAEIERLQEERDKLIEVLRWYADRKQYTIPHIGCSPLVCADSGQRARNTLEEIGVKAE